MKGYSMFSDTRKQALMSVCKARIIQRIFPSLPSLALISHSFGSVDLQDIPPNKQRHKQNQSDILSREEDTEKNTQTYFWLTWCVLDICKGTSQLVEFHTFYTSHASAALTGVFYPDAQERCKQQCNHMACCFVRTGRTLFLPYFLWNRQFKVVVTAGARAKLLTVSTPWGDLELCSVDEFQAMSRLKALCFALCLGACPRCAINQPDYMGCSVLLLN